MADKKFDLVFNASLEVGQVKTAVASLTKSLESAGAKIPQSMATNLNRMIQSLSTELSKLEGMTDIELDPKNAKNVGKSYEKIFQTFQQIKAALGDIHRTAGIDPEKFFPSEIASNIAKAAQAVQKYKKAMETGVKTDEHTKATKDIAEAEKKVKSLNDKLDEAARKRQSSSIVKDQLQETRKKLQAEKDQAEAEDKAAKEAQKAIQDRIKSQERLAQVEEEIAKKKKKQQEAVNKAAKANEVKNERESMKQAKGKGTDTKIYRDAVASYAESTAEVQKLQSEIDQLEAEYTQLSQTATVTADEIAAANERATKAATELTNTQKRLNKNQTDIDAADTKYAAATAEVKTLVPEVQKAENVLNQLIQKKKQLEASFEQSTFDELIQELEKLGVKLPDTKRNMEGVERALENLASEAKGKVVQAFNNVETAAEDVNKALKQTGQVANDYDALRKEAIRAEQDMENLKNQVLDFFSITNTIQIFKNAVRDAFDTIKELDAAMTETAVVTDFSVGDMWKKLPEYSEEATKLGASIKSLYEATTLYYQQGLNSKQAMGVGIETMKMARIANMDAAAATEAMTAALRGFNMEINEMSATRINDVYSELAAITAADTSQIATAMFKTASIASSANMEFETTAALLAQIIETTQEAPETAGTAMKTIIARFTEVKQLFSEGMLTGEDSEGEEININKIDAALKSVGISLKDFLNGSKGIDDIFLELASKWDTLDLATQRYIATTAAGSRQQSRFLAMMSNYERTMELVTAANDSAGASQKQFDKTLESLDAKLQKLENAWDEFAMGITNNEGIKTGIDLLTGLLEIINKLTDYFGEFGGMVLKVGSILVGLKAGKWIFNLLTGTAASSGISPAIKTASQNLVSFLKVSSGVYENVEQAQKATTAWSIGLGALGMVLQAMGTYLENLGPEYEDLGKAFKYAGIGVTVLSGAMAVLNVVAKATNTTMNAIALKLWPLIAIVTLVGVGIALLVKHFKQLKAASPEGQLELAAEATARAADAADQATEAYKELLSSLEAIKGSESNLEGLIKGTNEWKEAVIELNNQVLDLIEQYPELGDFIKTEGGVLTIDYDKHILKNGEEQSVDSIMDGYLQKTYQTTQIEAKSRTDEKKAEINVRFDELSPLATLDIVREEKRLLDYATSFFTGGKVKTTSKVYDEQQEETMELAKELAQGLRISGPYGLQKWLQEKGYDYINVPEYFDFDALREFGFYLLESEKVMESFTDSIVASAIASAELGDSTGEQIVQQLDQDVLRANYNQKYQTLLETEYRELTEAMKQRYADINNYQLIGGKFYQGEGEEKTEVAGITDEIILESLATVDASEEIVVTIEHLAQSFNSKNDQQKNLIEEIFSNEGEKITTGSLRKYGAYDEENDQYVVKEGGYDEMARDMGYKDIKDLALDFGIFKSEAQEILKDSFISAGDRIVKERAKLVRNMSKYSNQLDFKSFDANAELLTILESKYGESILETLSNVFSTLELTGDEELISSAYEKYKNMALSLPTEQFEEVTKFIEQVDWSNPISAAKALQTEIKEGTGATQEFAQALINVESSFLGPASQLQFFFESSEFTEMEEDIQEIIAANGQLSNGDVLDLADDYKVLEEVMESAGVTASGLSKLLEEIANNEIQPYQITDNVITALSSLETFSDLFESTYRSIDNFEVDDDEAKFADFAQTAADYIKERTEVGRYNSSGIDDYLTKWFGSNWDKNGEEQIEGQEFKDRVDSLTTFLEKNAENDFYSVWYNAATNKDVVTGQALTAEQIAARDEALGGLSVTESGGYIYLDGYEGKSPTEIIDAFTKAYGTPEFLTTSMMGGMKLASTDFSKYIENFNYEEAMTKLYNSLETKGVWMPDAIMGDGIRLIDESEVEAIAQIYGKNAEDIKTWLNQYNDAFFTDIYNDDGFLRSGEEIMAQMDTLVQSRGDVEAKWSDDFVKISQSTFKKVVDVETLNDELGKINIPEESLGKMRQEILDSVRGDEGALKVNVVLSDGTEQTITVTPQIDYETALANAEQANEWKKMAKVFGETLTNTPVSLDENSLGEVTQKINAAIENANTVIEITASEESLAQLGIGINTAVGETTPTAYVYGNVQDVINKVASLKLSTSVIVNYVEGETNPLKQDGVDEELASGIKNSPQNYTALVSEKGPELIQKADGYAYLSGTQGPEVVEINKGDTVYTAEETEKIFKNKKHKIFPRYDSGKKISAYGPGYGSSSSSGGSSSDDDEETWENPFDKLYNLVRKIDEEIRWREKIERRYEKLLESIDVSASTIVKVSREELAQLERERMLQESLISNRRYQIDTYQSENADLTKYANVVQNDRGESVLRIDWDLIDSVTDTDEGGRIEEYVSQLEEWFDSIEEAEDALEDIEDAVEEIKERGEKEYFDLEETIKDALTQSYQDEIDKLTEINNSINDTNASLLDAIQTTIDKQRQDRDNQRTEDDLAEKQRRLLYLQQDTSGANAMEILRLQEEITQGQEDYTDTLIDQKISELQEKNDEAAKQRDQQITLLQAQLDHYVDTGRIWSEVYSLMDEGLDADTGLVRGSRLEEILQSAEGYIGLSEISKMEWLNDTNNMIAQALAYLEIGRQLEDIGMASGSEIDFTTADGRKLTGTVNDDGSVTASDGQTYNNVFQGYDGKYYAGENIADVEGPVVEGATNNQSGSSGSSSSKSNPYGKASDQGNYYYAAKRQTTWGGDSVRAIQWALKDMGYDPGDINGAYGYYTWNAVMKFQRDEGITADGDYGPNTREKMQLRGYKTGGLADFTGPAWLDGTRSKPEYILNADQTKAFFTLVDVLDSLQAGNSKTAQNSGDNTYDIDINVESIGSDYDVEQLATTVKRLINEDARYRNNNAINLMR